MRTNSVADKPLSYPPPPPALDLRVATCFKSSWGEVDMNWVKSVLQLQVYVYVFAADPFHTQSDKPLSQIFHTLLDKKLTVFSKQNSHLFYHHPSHTWSLITRCENKSRVCRQTSRHETLTQCFLMTGQRRDIKKNIGSTSRVCWAGTWCYTYIIITLYIIYWKRDVIIDHVKNRVISIDLEEVTVNRWLFK